MPEELLSENQPYDRRKYLELLTSASATMLEPFGCSKSELNTLFEPVWRSKNDSEM
jgi:hypothetical protein